MDHDIQNCDRIPYDVKNNYVFYQDGASSHTGKETMGYLYTTKDKNRLISLRKPAWVEPGIVEHAPKSPDTNICDVFAWTYIEQSIWKKPKSEQPKTTLEMMVHIYDVCEDMSEPGTEANEKLMNAFYGTYDDKYGERRGGLEGRYHLMIENEGAALDSGVYLRKDRHAALPPDESRLAEIQIECDVNHRTKAEARAWKCWEDYKTKKKLCDQKVRDDLQVGIDHKVNKS